MDKQNPANTTSKRIRKPEFQTTILKLRDQDSPEMTYFVRDEESVHFISHEHDSAVLEPIDDLFGSCHRRLVHLIKSVNAVVPKTKVLLLLLRLRELGSLPLLLAPDEVKQTNNRKS